MTPRYRYIGGRAQVYTDDQARRAVQLRQQGERLTDIAAVIGASLQTIHGWVTGESARAKRLGLPVVEMDRRVRVRR